MGKIRDFLTQYHPIVHTLLLGTVVVNLVQAMCYPFFAIYLMNHTTLGVVQIGFFLGAGAFAGTIGGVVGGTISDRFGRRKVMVVSLIVESIMYLSYMLTTNHGLLFGFILIGGFCGSFFDPTAKALMADLTAQELRIRVFSLRYMSVNLGITVGPMIGAVLGILGEKTPFFVMSGVYFLYMITLQLLLRRFGISESESNTPEKVKMSDALRVIRMDRVLLLFIIGGVLGTIVEGRWSTPLSQYLSTEIVNGSTLFSLILTVNGGTVIFLQPIVSRWVEKRSPLYGVVMGSVLMAFGMLMFSCAHGWTLFLVGMVIFTLGEIMFIPSEYVLIDRVTPDGMRGTYYGAASVTGLGNFFGPWLCNSLLATFGGPIMFLAMTTVALLGMCVFIRGQQLATSIRIRTEAKRT